VTAAAQSAPCSWLRQQGLLAEEMSAGSAAVTAAVQTDITAEVAAHLATCPACARLHAEIGQLRGHLGHMTTPPPPPDWQRAVWGQIAAKKQGSLRVRWQKLLPALSIPVVAAALTAIIVAALRPHAPPVASQVIPVESMLLAFEFEPSPDRPRTRGGEVAVGDTVVFHATALKPLPANSELRVYRDDAGIVLRCGNQPPCELRGANLRARFAIPAIGRYRAMIVASAAALPAPTGFLDDDLAAISQIAGATWRWGDTIDIW
jgi:hypothetical protein